MSVSSRARLIQFEDRRALLEHLISQIPESEHMPNPDARHVLEACVEDCPACEKLTRYNNELRELGEQQQQIFLQIARSHIEKDTDPALAGKRKKVEIRRQWLVEKVEELGLDDEDINLSRRDRASLRDAYQAEFQLSDTSFLNDLKALGYHPK